MASFFFYQTSMNAALRVIDSETDENEHFEIYFRWKIVWVFCAVDHLLLVLVQLSVTVLSCFHEQMWLCHLDSIRSSESELAKTRFSHLAAAPNNSVSLANMTGLVVVSMATKPARSPPFLAQNMFYFWQKLTKWILPGRDYCQLKLPKFSHQFLLLIMAITSLS